MVAIGRIMIRKKSMVTKTVIPLGCIFSLLHARLFLRGSEIDN